VTNDHYIERMLAAPTHQADHEDFDELEIEPGPAAGTGLPTRLTVPLDLAGERLDKALARLLPSVSRSRIQQWIDAGAVRLNEGAAAVRASVAGGDTIELAPPPSPRDEAARPEPMQLDILYEDESILVVDKPPGLVVHPGAGNWSGTLLNGLLAFDPDLAGVPRAGIVHRLDAGTSGLMVVARSAQAQTGLVRQIQARTVTREYWAVVHGASAPEGGIDAAIARDPRNPLRFKVSRSERAKPAKTLFHRIQEVHWRGRPVTWLACRLETGRTHQIRVHLESIGLPLAGDPVYSRGRPGGASGAGEVLGAFGRQALHACHLAFVHPLSGVPMQWFRGPPPDMQALMAQLGFHLARRVRAFEQ